ncbi:MAG: Phospho-N-acetylmuramoyl-pentapeptide-transferase [Microgenomates bacterium 39_7]|nr:MAG: Phospho-N-acetylmuramoyl-pentapeptide-transferase [Microgenomates bacterium 39_7]
MNNLSIFLGLLIFCFVVTSVAIVPFINLLYALRFQRKKQDNTTDVFGEKTPVFNRYHQIKEGTPIGGGLLIVIVVSVLFAVILPLMQVFGIHVTSVYSNHQAEVNIIFFTFLSFSILGLYDDIKKFFGFNQSGFFGLRMKFKLLIQVLLAVIIALMLYLQLGISFLYIPFFGTISLGVWFVPFATFVIVAFANAVNITDGLDGLASGVLMISLFGLWMLSTSIVDVPLSVFLALWIGSLISFLYFNVYPARIMMGDVGALSFGATLGVVGLLLGKVPALLVIGFIFVVEVLSSLIQLISKKLFNKKVFTAAPVHLTLQSLGWHESKIVQRAWLLQIMLTIFGVWLAVI